MSDRPVPTPLAPLSEPSAAAFAGRHIGPDQAEVARMLEVVGQPSLEALVDLAVPEAIRGLGGLELPAPATELDTL